MNEKNLTKRNNIKNQKSSDIVKPIFDKNSITSLRSLKFSNDILKRDDRYSKLIGNLKGNIKG